MSRDRQPPAPTDLDDEVPSPDAPAGDAELAKARSFGELIDRMVAGQPLPPAMPSDDRALLDVATVVHAASGRAVLASARMDRLVEGALAQALDARAGREVSGRAARASSDAADRPAPAPPVAAGTAAGHGGGKVLPMAPSRRAVARVLPWAIAAFAVAAAIFLLLRPPLRSATAPVARQAREIPLEHRSRPADALVGRIAREHAGQARARLDTIYADRLAGYRDLLLSGRVHSASRSTP